MSGARGFTCADASCWFALLPHHFLLIMDFVPPVINRFFTSTPFGDSSAAKQVHCWWPSLWVKQSLFNENNISEHTVYPQCLFPNFRLWRSGYFIDNHLPKNSSNITLANLKTKESIKQPFSQPAARSGALFWIQITHGATTVKGTWLNNMKRIVPISVYLIILGREFRQSAPLCLMADIKLVKPSINSDTFSNTQILKKGWHCEISYSYLICWVGWGNSLSLLCFPVPCSG